jgi:hypothetical protein
MTARTAGWLIVTAAAVLPLAAAEPIEGTRLKARALYLKYAQAPDDESGPGLQESIDRIPVLPARRPETRPAANPPATRPSTRPADLPVPAAPSRRPEMDPKVLKQLGERRGGDLSILVAMADALFTEGRVRSAEAVYEAAMNQPSDPETAAWILHQLATCRRQHDPDGALPLYDKVRQEPADCPWRDSAEAAYRVLEWMRNEKLPSLVESASQADSDGKAAPGKAAPPKE